MYGVYGCSIFMQAAQRSFADARGRLTRILREPRIAERAHPLRQRFGGIVKPIAHAVLHIGGGVSPQGFKNRQAQCRILLEDSQMGAPHAARAGAFAGKTAHPFRGVGCPACEVAQCLFRLLCQMRPHCHPYPFAHAKMCIIREGTHVFQKIFQRLRRRTQGMLMRQSIAYPAPNSVRSVRGKPCQSPARLRPGAPARQPAACALKSQEMRQRAFRPARRHQPAARLQPSGRQNPPPAPLPDFFEASCPLLSWARRVEEMVMALPATPLLRYAKTCARLAQVFAYQNYCHKTKYTMQHCCPKHTRAKKQLALTRHAQGCFNSGPGPAPIS